MPSDENLHWLMRNGALFAVHMSLTTAYFIAFALALGAGNTVIGIIGAIPTAGVALGAIPGAKACEYLTRSRIFAIFGFLSRLLWIPLILTPFFVERTAAIPFIIVFYLAAKFFNHMLDPAFTTVLAEVVPKGIRGEYIGRRSALIGLLTIVTTLAAGFFLKFFPRDSPVGFVILFAVGFIAGIFEIAALLRVKRPDGPHYHHAFREFFSLRGHIGRFVVATAAFGFSFMIASPFFQVFWLRDLGISYQYFAVVSVAASVATLLALPHIGRLTDRFGDKPIAIMGMVGTAVVPFFHLFITPETAWAVAPIEFTGGLFWAAANIGMLNLLLDLTEPERRAVQVAEYNMLTSAAMVIGPVVGGLLADNVAVLGFAGIPLLFAISLGLRIVTPLLLLRIPEPRAMQEHRMSEVFHELIPFRGHGQRGVGVVVRGVLRSAHRTFKDAGESIFGPGRRG